MRTHYHVELDGHRLADRFPRRRPAWTMAIRLSKERPEARWRVVPCDGSLCRIADVGRLSRRPLECGWEVEPLQFPFIYRYAHVRC